MMPELGTGFATGSPWRSPNIDSHNMQNCSAIGIGHRYSSHALGSWDRKLILWALTSHESLSVPTARVWKSSGDGTLTTCSPPDAGAFCPSSTLRFLPYQFRVCNLCSTKPCSHYG
jgi:hypothetical protein